MKKVLIVDDIPEYIEQIASYLEDNFEILKATNFQDGLKCIESEDIDLAIIDIRLREDDPNNKEGLELLSLCKGKNSKIPVIIMSAYKEFDFAVEALNKGADHFMCKPIAPDELLSIVEKIT